MNPIIIVIIAVLLAVACIVLVFRFGKLFFKVFMGVSFLALVLVLVIGAFIVDDAFKFKDGLMERSNLLLLEEDGVLLAGVVLNPVYKETAGDFYESRLLNATSQLTGKEAKPRDELENPFTFVDLTTLNNYNAHYQEEMLENISTGYEKIFVLDIEMFKESDFEIEFGDSVITSQEAITILESDSASKELISLLQEKTDLSEDEIRAELSEYLEPRQRIRSLIFGMLLGNLLGEETRDITPIITSFKDGKIVVYPETLLFKTLTLIPDATIQKVADQITEPGDEQ